MGLVISLVSHTHFQPFEIEELDSLEMWSLLSSYFTLFFGMFFTDGIEHKITDEVKTFFTWLILFMNFVTFLKFVQCLYISVKVMSDAYGVGRKLKGGAVAAGGAVSTWRWDCLSRQCHGQVLSAN